MNQAQNEEIKRLTEASFAQNEEVKRISAWAAILFAPTLIGTVYGMNFVHIPELNWDLGYPFALALMIVTSVTLFVDLQDPWLALTACVTIAAVTAFDLVIRGGTVIDGTGAPGVRADVGVGGGRIRAVGDLAAAVAAKGVRQVVDATGRVVCPGFIDPHGHSDASVLVDGALASHLHQGYTTQLSGNCGDTLAPVTKRSREVVELAMAGIGRQPSWRTFEAYLEAVEREPLGPNHAFLVGHGTIRSAVIGPAARPATDAEMRAMVRQLRKALEAGAVGFSSGLIYPPGIHAPADELARLARVAAGRGALYASHIRNESDGLFAALDEAVATIRGAGSGARLQVSHLKAGSRSTWGQGPAAVERLAAARAEGLDVAADQYPYTAAATTLEVVLPPALMAMPIDDIVAALDDSEIRLRIKREIARRRTGLGERRRRIPAGRASGSPIPGITPTGPGTPWPSSGPSSGAIRPTSPSTCWLTTGWRWPSSWSA